MGSALHVPLLQGTKAGYTTKVTIFYKTTKDSTALQWLAKEYTKPGFYSLTSIHATRALDKHKERDFPISSANVNQYMPEHWHRYKVSPVVPCDRITWVYSIADTPSLKIVR